MLSAALCSIIAGILLGFSQPFFMPALFGSVGEHQWLLGALALIGYVPFFWAIRHQSLKATFWLTLLMMMIQYTIILYWLFIALRDHGHVASLLSVIIMLMVPLILALKGSAFFCLGRFISMHFSWDFLWIAPLCLTGLEYFRNFQLFGGFPWGNVGYSIARIDQFLQLASLIGVYGLVFFLGVINALFCFAIGAKTARRRLTFFGLALLIIAGAFGFGSLRLKDQSFSSAKKLKVALVQGNIPQEMKNRSRIFADEIIAIYMDIHRKAIAEGADLIMWPESSYPRIFEENIKDLGFSAEDTRATIVGATTYGHEENGQGYYHNSALLLNYEGEVVRRYDKTHLVPFGEYVPWPMVGVVDKVVPGMGAFRPGISYTPVLLAIGPEESVSIGTTICYEGIFPEISRAYANNGATLLVNITNDAWFGKSSGPYQHLLMYRLRSVESGLSFVRATNAGLTAWIDPLGREQRRFGLFERGLQISEVPLAKKYTLYTKIGDVIPILCLLFLIISYLAAVIPLRSLFRERRYGALAMMFMLIAIMIASTLYYSQSAFLTDEAAGTKSFFIFLLCVTVLVGALSRGPRSRTILLVSGAFVLTISVALAFFESFYFLLGLVPAVLIFLIALRIKRSVKEST